MSFWGAVLKPGQKCPIKAGDILHLSQACLHNAKPGKNYLQVTDGETTYALGCLEQSKAYHASFDLFFSTSSCVFSNKGESEIHLTGYLEPEGDDFDEDEESEEEAPVKANGKVSPKTKPASPLARVASPVVKPAAQDDDDDDEDMEEEEEEDLMEEEEEEDSAEEEVPVKANGKSPLAKVASPLAKPAAQAQDDEDDEDLEDEEEEEDDLEEDEEEESDEEAAEPPPAKKAKVGSDSNQATSTGAATAYVKELHNFLKKNGKTMIGKLGSSVKRPANVPKLGALFEQNKDKFVREGEFVIAK